MSDAGGPADRRRPGLRRVSAADLTPYGSDIGPRPVGAANAIAVRDGRIAWIGRDDEGLRDWRGPRTEVVDAHGGLITAGFDDAHIHLARGRQRARSRRPVRARVGRRRSRPPSPRHAAAEPDAPWVLGKGWLYVPFPGGLPDRAAARRGRPRSAGVHGLLRRPHRLGEQRGPPRSPASTATRPTPPTA